MLLALVGCDELAESLVRYLADSSDHRLVMVCDVAGDALDRIRRWCPQATVSDSWESLVAGRQVDAVIVARGPDASPRSEQRKRLAQSGVPLLLVHPACDMMEAYELEMIRRETGGVIVPYAPDSLHPIWQRVREWMMSAPASSAGPSDSPLQQLLVERQLADRSRNAVVEQISRDELLIRKLLVTIASVSAAGVAYDETSYANLSVCFAGWGTANARWSVASPTCEQDSLVSVVCRHGTAVVRIPSDDSPWSLAFPDQPGSVESLPPFVPALDILTRLQQLLHGKPTGPPWPSWQDACLSLETIDNVERSLRRKRAIDLNTNERSEENTFKGYMAAMGCLILLAVLAGFFVLAVVEGFRLPLHDGNLRTTAADEPPPGWPLWLRLWPVYPLVAFLSLQLLLRVARRASHQSDRRPS